MDHYVSLNTIFRHGYYVIYKNIKQYGSLLSGNGSTVESSFHCKYEILKVTNKGIRGYAKGNITYDYSEELSKIIFPTIVDNEFKFKDHDGNDTEFVAVTDIWKIRKAYEVSILENDPDKVLCRLSTSNINNLNSFTIHNYKARIPIYTKNYIESSHNRYYILNKSTLKQLWVNEQGNISNTDLLLMNTKNRISSGNGVSWSQKRDSILPKYGNSTSVLVNDINNFGSRKFYTVAGDKLVEMLKYTWYKNKTLLQYIKGKVKIGAFGDAPGTWSFVMTTFGFKVTSMSLMNPITTEDEEYDPLRYKAKVFDSPNITVILKNAGNIFLNHDLYSHNEWDVILIDAAIEDMRNRFGQEVSNKSLTLNSLKIARNGIKVGGVIIIKTFTLTQKEIIEEIINTSRYYKTMYLCKPISSRHVNSELYLIFIDKLSIPTDAKVNLGDLIKYSNRFMWETASFIDSTLSNEPFPNVINFSKDSI